MIQDVKHGTHRIGTYMYAISKCAFLLGFRLDINCFFIKKCGRGVATRRAQMVWPMMTVTVTNLASLDSNFEKFANVPKFTFLQNCCLVKPSIFVTATVIIG